MTDPDPSQPDPSTGTGITRRHLIVGLGAAGGAAGLLAAFPGNSVVAGPAIPSLGPRPASFPEVLQPPSTDLTYVGIDAAAFAAVKAAGRYFDDTSGAGANDPPDVLLAPLALPSGATIREVSVAWVGNTGPTLQIWRRPMSDASDLGGGGPTPVFTQSLPDQGAGEHAETYTADLPVGADATYAIRVAVVTGESVLGVTIGYEPPAALPDGSLSFLPLEPPTRPLDTRQPGYPLGKLASEEVRTLDLGLPPGARAAVLNLTITGTESNFGYVSVYAAGIPWPGNSSINWSSPELTAANCVITAVDDQGRIAIRGGEASTHVIVDVLGAFVLPAGIEVA